MNLFRNLLFWITLALAGALVAQLLVQDPGFVLVRYGGYDYTTNLPKAVLLLVGVLLGLWLLWKLLTLPFAAWRRQRERRARARLRDGLEALHLGEWSRAETLLAQAADDESSAALRVAAVHAAAARGDDAAVRRQLEALRGTPGAYAVAAAEVAMADGRAADALAVLDDSAAQPLPPRGLALRGDALAMLGRAGDAYGLLGALRQQQAWPPAQLQRREAAWAEAGLREAADANALADRWDALPQALKAEPAIVGAYATRAAAMRWDDAAAKSIEQALDTRWDESLAALYGRLPTTESGRLEARRAHAERWLQAHPTSPALQLTLARLRGADQPWPQVETHLHRALAHGAGAEAWEELGHGYEASGDELRARLSYANALRVSRGEPALELPGRDLRQRIGDEAAIEDRDEHGVPRLRG